MTDFQCPDCGWPRGPTHTTDPDICGHRLPAWFTDTKEGEEDGEAGTETQSEGAISTSGMAEGDGRSATLTEAEQAIVRDTLRENNARARDEARRQGVTLHPKLTPDIAGLVERLRDPDSFRSLDASEDEANLDAVFKEAADALERMAKDGTGTNTSGNLATSDDCVPSDPAVAQVTPDIAGLVERLREVWKDPGGNIRHEAADALERLQHLYSQTRAFLGVAQYELTAAKAEIARPPLEQEVKYLDGQIKTLLAENERLRALLDETVREREDYNGSHQQACLEIERLRAALEDIADKYGDVASANIARAALTGGEE